MASSLKSWVLSAPKLLRQAAFLYRSQFWDAARLGRFQDLMLRQLITHAAAEVPYYRALFARCGLRPENFRGRADMGKIPPLDKETLRTRLPEFVADNAAVYRPDWFQTSGSTGTPLRYMLDSGAKVNDMVAALRSYGWAGFRPGMKLLSIKDHLKQFAFHYSCGRRILTVDSNSIDPAAAQSLWSEINRLKPTVFRGYPFYLLMLYQYGSQAGLAMHRPEIIITTGESLSRTLRRRLQSCYRAEIFDYYGMTENTAMITECEHHRYHVIEDYAWHEFIDPAGNPVSGGRAELLATGFYNYAMPLIRYRCNDFINLAPVSEVCGCGRHFRLVESIEGRKEDYITTPEGGRYNLIETPLNAGVGIMMAQYVQDAEDHIYVNIVPGPDFQKESLVRVEEKLRCLVGNSLKIDFKIVEKLEQRAGVAGKVPFIFSRIGRSLYDSAAPGPKS